MAIIGFLLLGLVAGAIARFLVPGRDPMGWVGTIVLGCVGSLLVSAVVTIVLILVLGALL